MKQSKLMRLPKGSSTPWGPLQTCDVVTEGICFVSTASHGGYAVSADKLKSMPDGLYSIRSPYSPLGWWEEDCDWAIVALAFPEAFDNQTCYNAVRTVKGDRSYLPMKLAKAWLLAHPGNLAESKAEAFRATIGDKWELGGCSGGGEPGWLVYLFREARNKQVRFADYPAGQFFSDAEIEALRLPEAPKPQKPPPPVRIVVSDSVMFNEGDCGGVFDGVGVVSDADPGL